MKEKANKEAERLVRQHSRSEDESGFISSNKHRHVNSALMGCI